jgi:hypothetical protein
MVDVETVRYSVPHRLVREQVEVHIGERQVRVYHGTQLVASHHRCREPFARVVEQAHFKGLWRVQQAPVGAEATTRQPSPLEQLGRSLSDYAAIVEEVA